MAPDLDMARAFLRALDPEAQQFAFRTFADGKDDKSLIRSFHALREGGLEDCARLNRLGAGIFATISATNGQGCKKADITHPRAIYLDFDDAGTAAQQVARVGALLPPSMVVESSPAKFHVYWLMDGLPLERLEPWLQHLIQLYGADPKCKDRGRVLRLPGFLHQKAEPRMVTLTQCHAERRYKEADLTRAFGEPVAAPAKERKSGTSSTTKTAGPRKGLGGAESIVRKGGRNAVLVKEAGALRRRGYGRDTIYQTLQALNHSQFEEPVPDTEVASVADWAFSGFNPTPGADIGEARGADALKEMLTKADGAAEVLQVARVIAADPALSMTEREAFYRQAAKRAGVSIKVLRQDLAAAPADTDEGRPIITMARNDFAGAVDDALRILPGIGNLRQRGGELVEVVPDPAGKGSMIQRVESARLAYLLSKSARWQYDFGDGSPDPGVLQAVMTAGYWAEVPPLAGVLVQPALDLQSGALLCQPGYHPGSMREAVFDPQDYPAYAGTGAEALAELRGLLRGFPFRTATDEAAALAAILSAAVRPLMPTCPAFLAAAHEYGSGKTHLALLISEFAGGAKLQRWPLRQEEQDKCLFALLVEGRPAVVFDNIRAGANWASDTLAAILTSSTYMDRILGATKQVEVATACLIIATGNNIRAGADLARRVITIDLDPQDAVPMQRQFTFDPVAEVQGRHGRWCMVALKVLQEFLSAGVEVPLSAFGSFSTWNRIVRGCIVHHGLPDPLAPVQESMEMDEDRVMLEVMLPAWKALAGEAPVTLKHLVSQCRKGDEGPAETLKEIFEEIALERGEINLKALGLWLKKHEGRVARGLRLRSGKRMGAGIPWQVVSTVRHVGSALRKAPVTGAEQEEEEL